MADLPEPSKSEPSKPFVSKALEIAAWPISAAIGWWWGHDHLRNDLYDTLKHAKDFEKPIRQKHWDKISEISVASGDITRKLPQEHKVFNAEVIEYFRPRGFKNTLDYFRAAPRNGKIKAIMTAFGAGGITLGVILTLAENKGLQQLFSRKEKETDHGISK